MVVYKIIVKPSYKDGVSTHLFDETHLNAILLCRLFSTVPPERKLVKSWNPKGAELLCTETAAQKTHRKVEAGVGRSYFGGK